MNIDLLLNIKYNQPKYDLNALEALKNFMYSESTRARFSITPILKCPDCKAKIYIDSRKCDCDYIRRLKCNSCDISYPLAFFIVKYYEGNKYLIILDKCRCCRNKRSNYIRGVKSQKREKKAMVFEIKSNEPLTKTEIKKIDNFRYKDIVKCKFCNVIVTKNVPKCDCVTREYIKCTKCDESLSKMFFYGMGSRDGSKKIARPRFTFRFVCLFCYRS